MSEKRPLPGGPNTTGPRPKLQKLTNGEGKPKTANSVSFKASVGSASAATGSASTLARASLGRNMFVRNAMVTNGSAGNTLLSDTSAIRTTSFDKGASSTTASNGVSNPTSAISNATTDHATTATDTTTPDTTTPADTTSPAITNSTPASPTVTSTTTPNGPVTNRLATSTDIISTTNSCVSASSVADSQRPVCNINGLVVNDNTSGPVTNGSTGTECGEISWMRIHYGGTIPVALKFGDDSETYLFPKDALTKPFKYFELALKTENGMAFHEGLTKCVQLREITAEGFARLLKWLQTDPKAINDWGTNSSDSIDHMLQIIIAADYLQLEADMFRFLEAYVFKCLGNVLLQDRRNLTAAHIELVYSHAAFKSRGIRKRFVAAAVRPFLQQALLNGADNKLKDKLAPGHRNMEEWIQIVKHSVELWKKHDGYALEVMYHVSRTITRGLPIMCDPLDCNRWAKNVPDLGFSTKFTIS